MPDGTFAGGGMPGPIRSVHSAAAATDACSLGAIGTSTPANTAPTSTSARAGLILLSMTNEPTASHSAIALLLMLALSCTPMGPTPTGRQELQILSKGGPTVSIAINGAEVLAVECGGGAVVRPRVDGVPPLPWAVKLTDRDTGRVRLDERISELPRWLVIFRDSAGVSASPVSGPVPVCP
jgi:hypothetical protein